MDYTFRDDEMVGSIMQSTNNADVDNNSMKLMVN